MKNKNIIALLTDFGITDWYVSVMKGVILSKNPNATIVDITHDIPNHSVEHGAFVLWNTYKYFPKKTIFGVVVDPGVGTIRDIIYAELNDYSFIVPNNGILSYIIETNKTQKKFYLITKEHFEDISNTFHGRDIFAPLLAEYSLGNDIKNFAYPMKMKDLIMLKTTQLEREDNLIKAKVIYIDHFGNIFTNIQKNFLEKNEYIKQLTIGNNTITQSAENYTQNSTLFFLWNSINFLEIASPSMSAANILQPKIGQTLYVTIGRTK